MKKILNIHSHHNIKDRSDTIYSYIYPKKPDKYLSNKYYSIGIHPWYISKNIDWSDFFQEAKQAQIIAIGECGLDTLSKIPLNYQIPIFKKQAKIAEKLNKPLLIHMVRTTTELLAIKKEINPKQQWIIHGFRGKPQLAEQYYNHNVLLSIGSKFNKETVLHMPLEKLLLETDESEESIDELALKIAYIKKIPVELVVNRVHKNTNRIFFT